MQLRVKPSAWITTSGLSPDWTRSTARIRISSRVLWSRARASRRFMSHCTICLLTYELVNILLFSPSLPTQAPLTLQWPSALDYHALSDFRRRSASDTTLPYTDFENLFHSNPDKLTEVEQEAVR